MKLNINIAKPVQDIVKLATPKPKWNLWDIQQRQINRMTNWQISQWLRAGAVRDDAKFFANMPHRKSPSYFTYMAQQQEK